MRRRLPRAFSDSINVLYGTQTQRAIAAYRISGWPMPPRLIHAIAQVIRNTATSAAVRQAADKIIAGQHAGEFPVDIFQDCDGAATIANVNEVIAALANVPVAEVSAGQSSREVMVAAIRFSISAAIRDDLRPLLTGRQLELLPDGMGAFGETSGGLKAVADELVRAGVSDSALQVCRWVTGADLTVRLSERDGALPVIAAQLLESVLLLAAAIRGKDEV